MKQCRTCSKTFIPSPYQIKHRDYICVECNRAYQRQWRFKRIKEGKPVRGKRPPREWWKEYYKKYNAKPEVKKRQAEAMRRYRQNPLFKFRIKARMATRNAIVSRKLIRGNCVKCGEIKTEAHHVDYFNPLNVVWLCPSCHRKEHIRTKV